MRIWVRTFLDNRIIQETVVENYEQDTRTHKVFAALESSCNEFDLCKPIWLDKNIREFQRNSRTKFRQDSFVEAIDFDYMDFYVIEED